MVNSEGTGKRKRSLEVKLHTVSPAFILKLILVEVVAHDYTQNRADDPGEGRNLLRVTRACWVILSRGNRLRRGGREAVGGAGEG